METEVSLLDARLKVSLKHMLLFIIFNLEMLHCQRIHNPTVHYTIQHIPSSKSVSGKIFFNLSITLLVWINANYKETNKYISTLVHDMMI